MNLQRIELRHVRVPLKTPFRTARSVTTHKEAIVVRAVTDQGTGWGECAAEAAPSYSPEFIGAAWIALRDHLAPLVFRRPIDLDGIDVALAPVRGHHMAKAALEMALLDAALRSSATSLAAHLGATAAEVDVGVVVDLHGTAAETIAVAERRAAEGYRRVKLKIEPGRDRQVIAPVVAAIGAAAAIWVDANGSYTLDDALWRDADGLGLALIEQPLAPRDLAGHAALAARLSTPICLDESIVEVADVALAAQLGAARVVNLKPSRVGGIKPALALARRCRELGLAVWIGGMLDLGLARAANLALAAACGQLPGDISATDRYFDRDLTDAFVLRDGRLAVPQGPGLGVDVDVEFLDRVTRARVAIAGAGAG